jgi:hypothetical protein
MSKATVSGVRATAEATVELRLVFEKVFREKENVGGALGEAAHEVGVPLWTEGDVDADAVALGREAVLEIAANAVEHLKLEGMLVDLVGLDEGAHLVDDRLVVGGDAAEDSFAVVRKGDHALHQVDVVGVDVGLCGERDVGTFLVGSFAEADADSLPEEPVGVGVGAEEIGLQDGTDAAGKLRVQALGHGDGRFGVGGAFHVDPDEGFCLGGVLDHLADDAFGEDWVEVHADLRELDTDVGVQFARFDCIEELVVDGGGSLRLRFSGYALAERVEGGCDAFAVHPITAGKNIVHGHAGDEAA